jgi:hypothetical protein
LRRIPRMPSREPSRTSPAASISSRKRPTNARLCDALMLSFLQRNSCTCTLDSCEKRFESNARFGFVVLCLPLRRLGRQFTKLPMSSNVFHEHGKW